MPPAMFSRLQNLWPFSMLKTDDLKLSNQLVQKLTLPEHSKRFIYAASEPDSHAIIYILAAQNLSKQSAVDAEQLIKEVQPKAVICLVASSALNDIQEEKILLDDQANNVPTSSLGVIRKCLTDKINKEQYERFAKWQVLGEIFGIGLYGHFFAAKKAAEDIGSQFILLESPYDRSFAVQLPGIVKTGYSGSGFNLMGCLQTQMLTSLIPSIKSLLLKEPPPDLVPEAKEERDQPKCDYEVPPFAQSIYAVLTDLHELFSTIPTIKNALISAQQMLSSVNKGKPMDTKLLSEVHHFRIAIEALRTTLNEAARCPHEDNRKTSRLEFSQISSEDTSNAICAQALRNQARKFGSLVAIVDAGKLAGLRKQWLTHVPPEVADLTDQCFTHYLSNDLDDEEETGTALLADKPVVAVGVGATALLRATLLLKTVPVYALIKLATFKLPASMKVGLEHLQRTVEFGLHRTSGVSSAGAGTCPILNLSVSAEMFRAAAHTLVALAERIGLLGIQTSFYEIMRRRRVKPTRPGPLATLCCSIATCSGLTIYKDGIQCATDSVPSVPMIASMGRGLERLQQASEEVKQSGMKVQESLQSLTYNLKKFEIQ